MAFIVKKIDKKSGTTYVYESESYWDKEKKQPRSRRKLIGKIDEATGEIVPTGKKRKQELSSVPEDADTDYRQLCQKQAEELQKKEKEISDLQQQITTLTLSANEYKRKLTKINEISQI